MAHGMLCVVIPPVYLPMLASAGAGQRRGEWAAEPKLDGWRAIVTVDPSLPAGFEVRSRTGRFITTQVPELSGLADLGLRMVLDGELVAVSDDGDVDFYMLGQRMLTPRDTHGDAVRVRRGLDGIDCTQPPYQDRRQILEMLELSGPTWCTVSRFVVDDADDLLDACVRRRQEGIVLKRLDARYTPGVRTADWRKVKTAAWRTDHGPRRLPKEIRERIAQHD